MNIMNVVSTGLGVVSLVKGVTGLFKKQTPVAKQGSKQLKDLTKVIKYGKIESPKDVEKIVNMAKAVPNQLNTIKTVQKGMSGGATGAITGLLTVLLFGLFKKYGQDIIALDPEVETVVYATISTLSAGIISFGLKMINNILKQVKQ